MGTLPPCDTCKIGIGERNLGGLLFTGIRVIVNLCSCIGTSGFPLDTVNGWKNKALDHCVMMEGVVF